jgi:hypothetical protein
MHAQPDIIGAFNDRVRRHVANALRQYRDEQRAVSHEMAAKGLGHSGPHLRRRVAVLRKWMVALTDQCFEDVTRLPGTQSMHRIVHADFLAEQLRGFLTQAEGDVLIFDPGPAATNAIKQEIAPIREGLEHDLRDFQAQLWHSRSQGKAASVTNNTVNVHGSNVGSIQQAGEGATQTAAVHLNVGAVEHALDEFVAALNASGVPDEVRSAVMIEVETVRPQLKKRTPNVSIVREGLRSLRNIVEGVAAGLLATKLAALLTAAGIAIS